MLKQYKELIQEKEKSYPGKFAYNDKAWVSGLIAEEFKETNTLKNGEKMYQTRVLTSSLSENEDKPNYVPVSVPERMLPKDFESIPAYTRIEVAGTLRSCKKYNDTVKDLFIVAKMVNLGSKESEESENAVFIEGFAHQDPIYKTFEDGRRMSYTIVEVCPKKGSKSFISCVAWDDMADSIIGTINKGDKIRIYGSVRSRVGKTVNNGRVVKFEKYDVFIISFEKVLRKKIEE